MKKQECTGAFESRERERCFILFFLCKNIFTEHSKVKKKYKLKVVALAFFNVITNTASLKPGPTHPAQSVYMYVATAVCVFLEPSGL